MRGRPKINDGLTCLQRFKARHPEKVRADHRVQAQRPKGRYSALKRDATKRGLGFKITQKRHAALLKQQCFYCDGPLNPFGSGLDRIDNKVGYVLSNVRPCCKRCNRAKSDMTEEEFRTFVRQVYMNWVKGKQYGN